MASTPPLGPRGRGSHINPPNRFEHAHHEPDWEHLEHDEEYWEQLQQLYPGIMFLKLGMQDAGFISGWLNNYTDMGILTTLPELASKSGSFMAFKEHGIPVVCKQRTAALKNYNIPLDEALTEIVEDRDFILPARYQPVAVLDKVVHAFINDLDVK